jgi:pilus assembly protein CpaF
MSDLAQRVRHRLVATPGDLGGDFGEAVRAEAGGIVDDAVLTELREQVSQQLVGVGPLESMLALDGVTDVLVNGPRSVWFDRGFGMERSDVAFADDSAVRSLAQRLAAAAGQRLDDSMPHADAVLSDGTRLHAVLPPICATTTLSLRVLSRRRYDLASMVISGSMPAGIAELLTALVTARLSFLITGGTGSGKTTLLACLLGLASKQERIIVVEDAPELQIDHPHVVGLRTRPANVEGAGGIDLRTLVRQALRMRPDRLVVGEFRGVEMVELLAALNTGHEGGAATLHANSAGDVPARLEALGALAGLPGSTVTHLAASALRVVIHLRRDGPVRSVDEIALLSRRAGASQGWAGVGASGLAVRSVWSRSDGLGVAAPELARELGTRGRAVDLLGPSS